LNKLRFIKRRRKADREREKRKEEDAKIKAIGFLVGSETDKSVTGINAVANQIKTASDQQKTSGDKRDRREKIALGIAGVVAFFAFCQWRTMDRQLTVMAGQQGVMQGQLDEMRAEQRPWVSLTKDTGIEGLVVNGMNELRDTIRFGLQNTGKNPAVSVFVNAEMSIGTAIPYGTMAAWQTAVCGQAAGSLGTTMFPGSPEPIFSVETGLTATELADWKSLSAKTVLAPVVAACIVYEDAVTKKSHHTPVAYEIRLRAPRPGRGCCAIITSDLPLKEDEITLRPWVRGNLPPD
jgi:hypothetical protein